MNQLNSHIGDDQQHNQHQLQLCSISPRGDLAAWCTPDGVIKFYECQTSALRLEYASSAHLKGVCTSLEWCPTTTTSHSQDKESASKSRKKSKTTASSSNITAARNELKDPNLVALGTSQGSILIYHLAKASLHTILQDDSVSTKVNDLCWSSNQCIYSCSAEGSIMEWNPAESKLNCKWKASKNAITSILVDSKSEYLLAASRSIAVWDLASKTKLKTLTGHSNDIFKLLNLNNRIATNHLEAQIVNDYFISAASNDRVINTWMLLPLTDLAQSSSSALLSFSVSDAPVYIDVLNLNVREHNDTVAALLVVTSRGHLHIYINELVAPTATSAAATSSKKAAASSAASTAAVVKPIKQLIIESRDREAANVTLRINAAYLSSAAAGKSYERVDSVDIETTSSSSKSEFYTSLYKALSAVCNLVVVYGYSVNPRIEKLSLDELNESKTRLVREDPSKSSVSVQVQNTKIETPLVPKDLQVLVPSMVGPQVGNLATTATSSNSNKRKSNETNQMTLEEKLDLMGINNDINGGVVKAGPGGGHLPKTDNLLVLLVQGLQSNDSKTLNHVLQHKNDKVINKTVSLLPSQYIMSLVRELTNRLQGHAQSGLGMIKWLKAVLMIHTSYLMSYPDLIDSLSKLYESMNARTKLYPQLSKLQGKLQLAVSQIASNSDEKAAAAAASQENEQKELLYYQESTSEDEQIEDDLIPSHSEEFDAAGGADEFLFSDEEDDSTQDEMVNNTNG